MHALSLTTCLVQKSSQNLCQSIFYFIHTTYAYCNTGTASLKSIAGNLPEHTPVAYLGAFRQKKKKNIYIYIFHESGQQNFGAPPPKFLDPPAPNPFRIIYKPIVLHTNCCS